jgi:Rps23 Pro-64 3,4-dihydroxylase Tpa1-like proline 4-hydroxylase
MNAVEMDRLRKDFMERGLAIYENSMTTDVAEAARKQFQDAEYELIDQERAHHYEHVFLTESPYLPKPGETYFARFWRSRQLEISAGIQQLVFEQIKPVIEGVSKHVCESVDLRAYKMTTGDHFRVHIDEYAGPVGFIYYLCKGWKWDWGGVLMTADGDEMIASLPKFNQLIVLNHGKCRPPHFVTPVTSFAFEPRYMLVGFLK